MSAEEAFNEDPNEWGRHMAAILAEEADVLSEAVNAVMAGGSWEGSYRGANISVWIEGSRRSKVLHSRTVGQLFGSSSSGRLSKAESDWPQTIELQVADAFLMVRQDAASERPELSPEQIEDARRRIAEMDLIEDVSQEMKRRVRRTWRWKNRRRSLRGDNGWARLHAVEPPPEPPVG